MFNPSKSARTLLAGLSLAGALCGTSFALPEGGTVGNGQVNIGSPVGGQMTIQQLSDRAIINWNGFSINAGELVRFVQPSQLSAILNRITGQDPSLILGSLQANGRVFLVNPNGIVFGKDSQVDVGSLFATTLTLKDEDFLHDRFKLDLAAGQSPAAIINQGTLQMSPGGFLVLASPLVSNQGIILANVGQVALAAGSHSEINFDGQGLINLMVEGPHAEPGTVAISRGMLDNMVGDLLNLGPANSITDLNDGVQIAGAEGRLVNTGQIHADGAPGQAAGRVVVNSSNGTFLRPGSVISANGQGDNSNGGSVLAISEGLAVLDQGASLEAKPGTTGEGGFVEFSGHTGFRFNGQVDPGATGHFLLDPANLTIIHFPPVAGTQDPQLTGDGTIAFADPDQPGNTVSDEAINTNPAALITLQATNSITQNANAPISLAVAGHAISLSTQTGDITLLGGISTNQGTITIAAGGGVGLGSVANPTDTFTTNGGASILVTAGTGAIQIAADVAAPTVTMQAGTGSSIKYDPTLPPGSETTLTAATLNLSAPGGVFGRDLNPPVLPIGAPLQTHAANLNVNAGGNIFVSDSVATTVNATSTAGVAVVLGGSTVTVGGAGISGPAATGIQAVGDLLATGTSGTVGTGATPITFINATNIGTAVNPVKTAGQVLDLLTPGQVNVSQTGATTLFLAAPNGGVKVASDSNVSIANGTVTNPITQAPINFATSPTSTLQIATTGSLAYAAANTLNPTLTGTAITLTAPGGIGTTALPMKTTAANLALTSTGGSVNVLETDGVTVTGLANQDFSLASGPMTVGHIQAGGAITLTATGNIVGSGASPVLTGASATLSATDAIGASGNALTTQVGTLNLSGANGVFVSQQGAVNVSASSSAGPIELDVDGDATLGLLTAATTIRVETCPTGSILDGNGDLLNIQSGGATTLVSPGVIGTRPDPLDVNVASGALNVASGGQLDGVSVSIKGTAPNNALTVVAPPDPPVGTTCFVGLPPGLVLFNVAPEPPQPPTPPAPIVVTPERVVLGAVETVQAIESVQLSTATLFNPPLPLDIRGEVMGSAFTPFYTFSLAFLIDEEDWLAFLQETVVWEADEEESQEIK